MKYLRVLFLLVLILVIALVVFYYLGRLKNTQDNSNQIIKLQQETLGKLDSQIQRLKDMLEAIEKSELTLKNAFDKEREKVLNLQEKLRIAIAQNKGLVKKNALVQEERKKVAELQKKLEENISQNETLSKGLAELKLKIELTRPIKQKLIELEDALSAMLFNYSKDKEVRMQLESLAMELESINNSILQLFAGVSSYAGEGKLAYSEVSISGRQAEPPALNVAKNLEKDEIKMATQNYQKLQEELMLLQEQIEVMNKDYSNLNKEYKSAKERLSIRETELTNRGERILLFQERMVELKNKLEKVQSQCQAAEKESALLRECYVSLQLEREGLSFELNQTRLKLAELQNKLNQIGSVFIPPDQTGFIPMQEETESPARKVDVELMFGNQSGSKNEK